MYYLIFYDVLSNILLQYVLSTDVSSGLSTKQNTLTASTTLFGIGSSITNITYGNIIEKPTNFQAEWLSTVINKPSTFPVDKTYIYTKTEVNELTTLTNFIINLQLIYY
jgi:hypothetical protein